MQHQSGVPANEKEAMNLGRGGKFASPGTNAHLARLQNSSAKSYHDAVKERKEHATSTGSV